MMKKLIPMLLSALMFTGCAGTSNDQTNSSPASVANSDEIIAGTSDDQTNSHHTSVNNSDEFSDETSNNQTNTYRQITMDEAVTMMAQETDYIILDVRRPDEFSEGHIPNAINVANESISTAEIPELPDKNQLIMVYCRSGRRSKEASEKLVKLVYTNIVEFGGILDWKGDIVTY
jgi:rhodanese-related sulfurtransferase